MATEQKETRLKDPMAQVLDPLQFHDGGADLGAVVPAGQTGMARAGGLVTGMQGDIITAQRVAVPRNMSRILANMKALATAAGKEYVYGWEVNDRKNNRKVWIEGPTITLANDLAREYMNCQVDCRVMDEGKHWVFYARFVDLETGFTMVRAYQQRKQQKTGMEDDQRALDMVFQIGQSKAIRNVVVNALRSLVNYAVDAAKGSLLDKVGKNPEGARTWIRQQLRDLGVDIKRVEALYGRTAEHWTVPDMARIYTELQSIIDGMMNAEDVYPIPQKEEQDSKRNASNPLAEGQVNGVGTGSAGGEEAAQQQRKGLATTGAVAVEGGAGGYGTVLNVTAGASGVGTAGTGTAPGSLMDAAEATLGTGTAQAQAQQEPAAAKATKPAGKKKPALFGGDA